MCAVGGVLNIPDAAVVLRSVIHALQNRGRDGCGMSVVEQMADWFKFNILTFPGTIADNFDKEELASLPGREGVAHARYATAANSEGLENLQPFFFYVDEVPFAIVHNGNFTNTKELEATELKGTPFRTASDTERFLRLILREHRSEPSLTKSTAKALVKMRGTCSAILHTPGMLLAIRDSSGNRPLFWGRKGDGFVVASETCALDAVDIIDWQEVPPGSVMQFTNDGKIEMAELPKGPLHNCVFEYVYFGFPTSQIHGASVRHIRTELGAESATQHGVRTGLLTGIPDSGIEMATGFASRIRNYPADQGVIVRRHDTGRTFILRGQEMRKKAVSEKFSFDTSAIRGNSIVLIDDSLVRGTTSRGITEALRLRGATQVHWRIPSPMVIESCVYGINTSRRDLLLAVEHNRQVEAMREDIGADSLEFLDLQSFKNVLQRCGFNPENGCYTCMDGVFWHENALAA